MTSRFAEIEEQMQKDWAGVQMVCVDDSFSDEQAATCNCLPARGQVYTIRAIRVAHRNGSPDIALLFEELVNTRLIYGKEPGFWHDRFDYYCIEACSSDNDRNA